MTMNEPTRLPLPSQLPNLLPSLRALIDRHGAFAVGLAYLRAAWTRKPRPPDPAADGLSDHMRRDIGLRPQGPDTKAGRRGWDF